MSIPVSLDALRAQIEEWRTDAYLLTVGDDERTHSVAVPVRWDGDVLIVPAGRTTGRNAAARPLVALLWPPVERGGFSLIVDATAVIDDAATDEVRMRPTRAVLHRPAPSGAGSECQTVGTESEEHSG
jgi:hypothetical protein